MFLRGHTYDVGVMVIFLFEMVFMDTALTIVTGACAERWKFLAFTVSSILMGAITYPLYGNWAWGGGWLSQLGHQRRSGQRLLRFRRIGRGARGRRNHGAGRMPDHRPAHRQVQPRRIEQSHPRPRYFGRADRLLHPGLRLVRIQPRQHAGRFRRRQPAHRHDRRRHHAGRLHRNDRRHPLHVGAQRQAGLPP